MASFEKLFSSINNINEQKLIFKEIRDLNKEIEKIRAKFNLENEKWDKTNPLSVFNHIENFNRWLAIIRWETSYERKRSKAIDKNYYSALTESRILMSRKGLSFNSEKVIDTYKI